MYFIYYLFITCLWIYCFSRLPSKRICKLEVFWSWKEILNSMNTIYPKYELLLENILNVIMLLCRGMFDVDDIIHNSLGFLIGIVIINKVVLMNKIS